MHTGRIENQASKDTQGQRWASDSFKPPPQMRWTNNGHTYQPRETSRKRLRAAETACTQRWASAGVAATKVAEP
jgi:hypothetical protein